VLPFYRDSTFDERKRASRCARAHGAGMRRAP
jgi:hypothetical protein